MYCNQCGAEIPNGSKFCNNCGNQIQQGAYFSPPSFPEQNTKKIPEKPKRANGLYYNAYKGFNNYEEKQTIFVFIVPNVSKQQAIGLINSTLSTIGKVKQIDERRGYLKGQIHYQAMESIKVEYYISERNDGCYVRTVMKTGFMTSQIKMKDVYWDYFLQTMFSLAPNKDFGVSLANKQPYLLAVKFLGSDRTSVTNSSTTGGTSLLGFLAGDALFGTAGAIVGGMSGTKHSTFKTKEQFSKSQLVRIIYNNGRMFEGEVGKKSQLYNYIMAEVGY